MRRALLILALVGCLLSGCHLHVHFDKHYDGQSAERRESEAADRIQEAFNGNGQTTGG